jgi:hypothetical protein
MGRWSNSGNIGSQKKTDLGQSLAAQEARGPRGSDFRVSLTACRGGLCDKMSLVRKSENRSISSICRGREVAATYQKLNAHVIRRSREPGAAEIIIDKAGWENGQNVESRVAKN